MGNCQAIDTATLVIQHPSGKIEKFYWPVNASEIMRMNPGHYVALLISTTLCPTHNNNTDGCPTNSNNGNSVRLTRIKLLRPTDTLVLGQVYRLITTQGVWVKFCFVSVFWLWWSWVWLRFLCMFLVCWCRCDERVVGKEEWEDEQEQARIGWKAWEDSWEAEKISPWQRKSGEFPQTISIIVVLQFYTVLILFILFLKLNFSN